MSAHARACTCRASLATAALAALAVTTRPAPAQPVTRPAPAVQPRPAQPRHLLSVSAVQLLFGVAAADYEQAVRRDLSLGASAVYSAPNDVFRRPTSDASDLEVSAAARYYLYGNAPVGASVGLTGGVVSTRRRRLAGADPSAPAVRAETVPSLGFTADYNQFFGRDRRFVLGTGSGIRRRFAGSADARYAGVSELQFVFRFLLGYAW